ncbi:hypothetical protein QP991_11075, partial [Corynebacterium amycolatum]|uniref:hypothetical protein n=2 Tax=Corynebacterium TaxID=1716 RepID=UPI00254ADABD
HTIEFSHNTHPQNNHHNQAAATPRAAEEDFTFTANTSQTDREYKVNSPPHHHNKQLHRPVALTPDTLHTLHT